MAALSARCLRSFARVSVQMSKTALNANSATQVRSLSSAAGKSILRDCGLLKTIARDNVVRNLARRHTRLSAAVSLVISNPPVMIENSESDDDSLEAVCGDDDETFSCCEEAIPGL
ncbi:uncharacterized protein LOC111331909 isoform X2 [Stylophora pistillata]|uniref:uncharacterized protein LOC111331909 isoform X2 n=1 Tax=Stylophora pistillata TaxID=50429 RepID=UPI000C04E55A|nr:uncharacterized protein LOC111331909 isoform X2 [Stylophora pistillata]